MRFGKMLWIHFRSIFQGKWDKARCARAYSLFQLRQDRGASFTGETYNFVKDTAIFTPFINTLNQVVFIPHLGFELPIWSSVLFAFMFFIGTYILGYYDQKVLGFWQIQNEISTKEINPYFIKLEKEMAELKEMLKKKNG